MRFYGLFILLVRSLAKNLANAIFGYVIRFFQVPKVAFGKNPLYVYISLYKNDTYLYRGFSPYATFGTWKKTALAKNRISKIFIPTQDKNRPKADFCPSGFIIFGQCEFFPGPKSSIRQEPSVCLCYHARHLQQLH